MKINGVPIDDVAAEAFSAFFARLVVTARNGEWVYNAARSAVGCATSIIGCACEAGIEAHHSDFKTPDARPGHELLFFAKTKEGLCRELVRRVGQTLLTVPTVTVFNGLEEGENFELGTKIGFFGNGFEKTVKRFDRECVSVPITSGEFLLEKTVKIGEGVAGANFWIYAESHKAGLKAAEKAVRAISVMPGLILPFTGGVVASASRMGSRYSALKASTQEDFCPSIPIEKNPDRKLPENVKALFEIIIDAVSLETAKSAMAVGIRVACGGGVVKIGSASFGGKLGSINIPLRDILGAP